MASGEAPCPEHPRPTRRGKRYCFSAAHHGRGTRDDAQWAHDLDAEAEFAIFDEADWRDWDDARGNLYGLRLGPDGATILDLGTQGEQVAKFWSAREGMPWHGFPLWPLADAGPQNRRGQVAPREALRKMEQSGILQAWQRKKLEKGRRI